MKSSYNVIIIFLFLASCSTGLLRKNENKTLSYIECVCTSDYAVNTQKKLQINPDGSFKLQLNEGLDYFHSKGNWSIVDAVLSLESYDSYKIHLLKVDETELSSAKSRITIKDTSGNPYSFGFILINTKPYQLDSLGSTELILGSKKVIEICTEFGCENYTRKHTSFKSSKITFHFNDVDFNRIYISKSFTIDSSTLKNDETYSCSGNLEIFTTSSVKSRDLLNKTASN